MAPNSEEDSQGPFPSRRGWAAELLDKEPLRPPVYNPEDYATSLKKWGRRGCGGVAVPQYLSQSTGSLEKLSEELSLRKARQSSPSTKSSSSVKSGDEKLTRKDKELTLKTEKKDLKNKENINRGLRSDLQKDFLHPVLSLSNHTGEMTLRQFSSVTELLTKLKVDLKLSFPSFVQEFVGDPIDGVTLLLELLRCVQVGQASQQQRCPPQLLRRALLDEHACLLCLKHCLRCEDASRRLASSPGGLFTVAVCIMSSVTQSRVLALELLSRACEPQAGGHKAVSEALSTLRLRFGEPVRFRFLVGMLSSAGAVELLSVAMRFINAFVESAPSLQQKVYIQAELEQAGFSSEGLRKSLPSNSESVKVELNKWEKNYFDVEKLRSKVVEVNVLQEKVVLLEKRIKILQEEKGILQSLEQCLKERCCELEEEVSVKTNASSKHLPVKAFRSGEMKQKPKAAEKGESTPAEDEGISSSEQELSQDEDYVKRATSYSSADGPEDASKQKKAKRAKQAGAETNRYPNKVTSSCDLKNLKNMRSSKMKESNVDDGNEVIPLHDEDDAEEETTIDEVIEELENIVNDAETAAGGRGAPAGPWLAAPEKVPLEEAEIVPALLHPQPPKRAKSLVHIYFPGSELGSQECNKNEFFEGSDSESSDSLLTAAREGGSSPRGCRRSLAVSNSFNSYSSANTRTLFIRQEQELEDGALGPRPAYEERNIDEEEVKRKHLKSPQKAGAEVQSEGRVERAREGAGRGAVGGSGFPRAPKVAPTPVKRSQTFHMTSSEGEGVEKRAEVRPRLRMGVSGLDLQQRVKSERGMWEAEGEGGCARGGEREAGLSVGGGEGLRPAARARSMERMDEGLDSLVDIVIAADRSRKGKLKSEWSGEGGKNIGPRTRRSLAESSLFCSQLGRSGGGAEETRKPPKPAERTSLARNNSSASPLRPPAEVKAGPGQPSTQPQGAYLGLKAARSADSLATPSHGKRCPPEGSGSPADRSRSQDKQGPPEDRPPLRPNKLHTFFGNPKFGSSGNDSRASENYFESNYAVVGGERAGSWRDFQSALAQEKAKSQGVPSGPPAAAGGACKRVGERDTQAESKPSFLLGTYQSQPQRTSASKPKVTASVLQCINSFNSGAFADKSLTSSSGHPRGRQGHGDVSSRQSSGGSGKVTDSPSGLY